MREREGEGERFSALSIFARNSLHGVGLLLESCSLVGSPVRTQEGHSATPPQDVPHSPKDLRILRSTPKPEKKNQNRRKAEDLYERGLTTALPPPISHIYVTGIADIISFLALATLVLI